MQKRAKNEVFGHFLELGLLDRLDIAYYDSIKCFLTSDNYCIISIIYAKKEPKMSFLAILSSFVCSNRLILHIVIDKNDS